MNIKYFVQRKIVNDYVSYKESYATIEEAKQFAEELDIGTEPEALRVVDDYGNIIKWVPRNGWKPCGGLSSR